LGQLLGFKLALLALTLSGAPSVALSLGGIGASVVALKKTNPHDTPAPWVLALCMAFISLGVFVWAYGLGLFEWRAHWPTQAWRADDPLRLILWFGWPAWPLALWSIWRWRHQWRHGSWPPHLALPLGFLSVSFISASLTQPTDRALLLGLPALSALASLALPTLSRRLSALIDWFTLLFFALTALLIWFYWCAAVTGSPAAAAAAVARRAPGFVPHFVWSEFTLALLATLAYAWLLVWRIGRHRSALWKSLVLPAGGTVLAWVLFMTLWLPALNYALSYEGMVQQARQSMELDSMPSIHGTCVEQAGLSRAQIAAFQYYAPLHLQPLENTTNTPQCAWLLTSMKHTLQSPEWQTVGVLQRPTDRFDQLVLYRRRSTPASPTP
jgi:4-amino-4-deoxy-L-arabinose transferase-like glycosyltransferase